MRIKISWGVLGCSFLIRWPYRMDHTWNYQCETASWQKSSKSNATVKYQPLIFKKLFEIPEEMPRKIKQGLKWYLIILTGVVVGESFQITIFLGLTTFFIHYIFCTYITRYCSPNKILFADLNLVRQLTFSPNCLPSYPDPKIDAFSKHSRNFEIFYNG